jgi:hypothetical protein
MPSLSSLVSGDLMKYAPQALQVASGLYGAHQSRRAAEDQANAVREGIAAQERAADRSLNLMREMWQQGRADQMPWLEAGRNALNRINELNTDPNSFTTDPGYQFRVSEGEKAINRAASARGFSGATLKALAKYGQNVASDEFGNVYDRFARLAGMGQNQSNTMANQGSNFATSSSNTINNLGQAQASGLESIGNARAAGRVGATNNILSGVGSAIQSWENGQNTNEMLDILRKYRQSQTPAFPSAPSVPSLPSARFGVPPNMPNYFTTGNW